MLIYSTLCNDRNGSETVYALLRTVFSSIYTSALPEIKKTPNGKPYFPGLPNVHFSLSHTRTHVLCAISDKPIGCDIEASTRNISSNALPYFACDTELEQFTPLDLWVLKESYTKLLGETFASIRRHLVSREGSRIIFDNPNVSGKLYEIDGCRAAVCSLGDHFADSIMLV
jgi:4'-phosphopantetheinyl transferase